ncbi:MULTISPECIES: ArsR/SmtB family transcription factor [unclassified Streptomyces]|uniref:ArsR/SmtB family transcription factor n=1 Tax=unclassified Streptomyces TaxID=2593676 RepID=UPI0037F71954
MHADEAGARLAGCPDHPAPVAVLGATATAPATHLDAATASVVAATLQALATPSRLLILSRLRRSPHPVTELATAIGMEQSAVSHQLRLLRALGLVVGHRDGRRIVYSLYDTHVAQLLDEAVHHIEHLRLGHHGTA